jgi:hypothetical protein
MATLGWEYPYRGRVISITHLVPIHHPIVGASPHADKRPRPAMAFPGLPTGRIEYMVPRNETERLLFCVLLCRAFGPGRGCALGEADKNTSPPEAESGFGFLCA